MRRLRVGIGLMGSAAALVFACSGDDSESVREPLVQIEQPITGKCGARTVGMACDPDDDGGETECQGICLLDTAGDPACVTLAKAGLLADALDGAICGSAQGTDCTTSCDAG